MSVIDNTAAPPRHAKSPHRIFEEMTVAERNEIYAKLGLDPEYGSHTGDDKASLVEMNEGLRRVELAIQLVSRANDLINSPVEVVGPGWHWTMEACHAGRAHVLLVHAEKNLEVLLSAARTGIVVASNDRALEQRDAADVHGAAAVTHAARAEDAARDRFKDALDLLGYKSRPADEWGVPYAAMSLPAVRAMLTRVTLAKELQHRALDLIRQPVEDAGDPGWNFADGLPADWYIVLAEHAEQSLDSLLGSVLCAFTSKANDAALSQGVTP